jgi:hypothetical protein
MCWGMEIGTRREKMVFENLMALWIAVEKQCPQEVAFKDVEDVMKFRKEGINCTEIGSYYGLKGASISYLLCRKRKEVRA